MPFAFHLAVVKLTHISGLDADADLTGYAFQTAVSEIDATGMATALEDLYGGANVTFALCEYLQRATISTAADACEVSIYGLDGHLDGSAHGSPYAVAPWTFPTSSVLDQGCAPAEFSGVCTLYAEGRATAAVEVPDGDADGKRDRPKQRHTGRQYLGPLQGNALELISNEYRLRASYCEDVAVAMARFRNTCLDNLGATLSVWSRKDGVLRMADAVSIDNAPDIQRRRGVESTARVVDSLLAP